MKRQTLDQSMVVIAVVQSDRGYKNQSWCLMRLAITTKAIITMLISTPASGINESTGRLDASLMPVIEGAFDGSVAALT